MKLLKAISLSSLFILLISNLAVADCVFNAQGKTRFSRLDSHTIILSGGAGRDIMLKTFCFIYRTSEVQVLQDSFCSYASDVLYIDGNVCGVNKINWLD